MLELYYTLGMFLQLFLTVAVGLWILYWTFVPPLKGVIVWLLRITLKVWKGRDLQ